MRRRFPIGVLLRWGLPLASLLLVARCQIDPISFVGKSCSTSADCPEGLVCQRAACAEPASSSDAAAPGADASVPEDAAGTALEDAAETAPDDAGGIEPEDAGAGSPDAEPVGGPDASEPPDAAETPPDATVGRADAGPTTVAVYIAADSDDAVWIRENNYEERLHYASDIPYLEVGADSEAGRTGLRFLLPVPRNATILGAFLRIGCAHEGTQRSTDTFRVRVWDTSSLAPFGEHHHPPEAHDPAGVCPSSVGNWPVCDFDQPTTSPDISSLVQHIVSRDDWVSGGPIGFLVEPDHLGNRWVGLIDYTSPINNLDLRSRLEVTYSR